MWRRSSTRPAPSITSSSASSFPTIAGAFGTADLIVRIGDTIHVIDFKFGAGVRVLALYPDGDEDVINAQLLFYAAAARHSLPEFFAGVDNIVLTILQPQSIEPDAEMVSSVEVTHAELDEFIAVYRAACAEALSDVAAPGAGRLVPLLPGAADLPGAHRSAARSRAVRGADARRAALDRKPTCSCSPPAWTWSTRSRTSARRCTIRPSGRSRTATSCPATRSRPAAPSATGTTRSCRDRRADRPRPHPRRRHRRDAALAKASRTSRQSARPQSSHRIHRFASLRRLAGAERERTRPGARTGRDRAVIFRGTRSLPRREATMTKIKPDHDHDHDPRPRQR